MGTVTISKNKEYGRLADEMWSPLNQALYPKGENCPEIGRCELYDEKKADGYEGYVATYCNAFPNACELDPFNTKRFEIGEQE